MALNPRGLASILAIGLLALTPATVRADSNTVLQGRVYANGGKPVAGVFIEAAAPSGRYRTRTGPDGRFVMFGLENDTYTVIAEKDGFGPTTVPGTVVAPGETDYVVFRFSERSNCSGSGYSLRSSASYLLEARPATPWHYYGGCL